PCCDHKMASAEQLYEQTGCIVGAVPPFSTIKSIQTLVDPLLLENKEIVFNAGTLGKSIFLRVRDYIDYFDFLVENIACDL
ncbi:YbaK/EbsC family protein, partial [Vibrio sp. PP-XX7]